ncbi:sulfur oxidation c-type cytochrome SoxX [Jannaschia sp. KMU-145]|uniref:sulfur oxidation c-type cytochrome SoxX n=1 Tax=Jannaschia halovivens TaxID=3388667 RepID=UPI00396B21D4
MKRTALGIIASAICATTAFAADVVAPGDVEFDEYGAIAASLTGAPGDVANGELLMNKGAGNCIACHAVTELEALGFHGEIGPMLDGVADRWTEADLRGIVANAKMMFDGTMMPSFYKTTGYIRPGDAYTGKAAEGELAPLLTAQEVEDVVAYLMTLKES